MDQVFNQEEYLLGKSRDLIRCKCVGCSFEFKIEKHFLQAKIKNKTRLYCSRKCYEKNQFTSILTKCKQCHKKFYKRASQIKKHPNNYCSSSCSATYNNAHKKSGVRRSKLEIWLEKQLPVIYPDLKFHFNRKDAINSELDIYIPSLKLAFELNGIFHYEPIFGKKKLKLIQNNDGRKFQACLERGIELCIIDTSKLSYFKEASAIKFLKIIESVIQKLI